MKLKDTGGGDFVQASPGNHPARCIRIIDVGTQEGEYAGKPTYRRQIVLMWELPNELVEVKGEQKPAIVSKWYTASLSEKAKIRADLESWRGRPFTQEELMGFEVKNVLDKCCLVNVVHSEKGKAKVTAVTALPKDGTGQPMSMPPRGGDLVYFSLERDEFKADVFDSLSDYWKEKITGSPEYQAIVGKAPKPPMTAGAGASKFDDFEDDIPF